jgi:hypothetical protein
MHYRINLMSTETILQVSWIADIALEKVTPFDEILVPVYHIVNGHRLEPFPGKCFTAMGSDVSGTTCHQYIHYNFLYNFAVEFN